MLGEGAALASAFLWALSNILMGSQAGRVPTVVISALRGLFGAVFLAAAAAAMYMAGRTAFPTLPAALGLAGSGIMGFGIGDTLYIGSLHRVGVSRAFPISMAVYPLLTIVLAVVLLDERITGLMIAGTVLTLAGVWLIVSGGEAAAKAGEPAISHKELMLGLAFVAIASVLWACATVWLRSAADGVEPVMAQAIRIPAAGIVTAGIALVGGHVLYPRHYGQRSLMALLLTGIVGTALGSLLFVVGLQRAGAASAAVLSSSAPLFAMPMAAFALGEQITRRVTAGTALSIAGIWLVILG
jgi:drug/metabolite transporter (DMT)-like permease